MTRDATPSSQARFAIHLRARSPAATLGLLAAIWACMSTPAAGRIVTTRTPVASFAPLVHIELRERAYPMSVTDFLARSWLMWRHGRCPDYSVALRRHIQRPEDHVDAMGRFDRRRLAGSDAYRHGQAPLDCNTDEAGATFSAAAHTRPYDRIGRPTGLAVDEGFYLDLLDRHRPGTRSVTTERGQTFLRATPVYYVRAPEGAGTRLRITYWFFYGWSIPRSLPFGHEGDWERVSVLLRVAGPGRYVPLSVRYHYHARSRVVAWAKVGRVRLGSGEPTHPVAFSARGSHASYPTSRGGRALPALTTLFDDVVRKCLDCPQWRTWQQLVDATTQPWYGFGGAWGEATGSRHTSGPLGPSPYKR